MKTKLLITLLVSTFFLGCQKDTELTNSAVDAELRNTRAPEKMIVDHDVHCSEYYAIGNEYTLRITIDLNQAGEQVEDHSQYVMYWRESSNDDWQKHDNGYTNTSYPLQFWFNENGPVASYFWDYLQPGGGGPVERCLQFYLHYDHNDNFPNTIPHEEISTGYYYITHGNDMSFEGCATCD